MKLGLQSIEVQEVQAKPAFITWRNRRDPVREILDEWIVQGRWWEGEERRVYFRVRTNRAVLEVYRKNGSWKLARTVD